MYPRANEVPVRFHPGNQGLRVGVRHRDVSFVASEVHKIKEINRCS